MKYLRTSVIILSMSEKKKKTPIRKFDLAWKSIIKELFEDFFEFFFPEIYDAIDFSKKPQFIDKELNELNPGSPQGNRTSDILVKVFLKDGSIKFICIVIHIEVQGQAVKGFMERMFIYYYRAFDKEKKEHIPVISLAILTDDKEWFRPGPFSISFFGFELVMKVPYIKLIDYKFKKELVEKLETSKNPMVMVVKALLKSHELAGADSEKTFEATKELIRQCYQNGYSQDTTYLMLKVFELVLRIPEALKNRIKEVIKTVEEEKAMDYIPIWLKDDVLKGRKEGRKEGRIEGRMEGIELKAKETAKKMLLKGYDINEIIEMTGLDKKTIESLTPTSH